MDFGTFLMDLVKFGAPIVGSFFGPVGTAIGAGVSGLVGNLESQQAAGEAESKTNQYIGDALAYLKSVGPTIDFSKAARQLAESAAPGIAAQLASTGGLHSSVASNAFERMLGDVVAKLTPAQAQAQLGLAGLMMQPYSWGADFYAKGAQQAANAGGFDLGFLAQLAPYLFGGGGGGSSSSSFNFLDAFNNRSANIPGGY